MNKIIIKASIILTAILFVNNVYGQHIKFSDLTFKDFEKTQDEIFPNASAVIMYKDISFDYGKKLFVSERIKIYKKEGFEYSNWETNFDNVKNLQAYIYNLENGVVVKTRVEKQSIFKEKLNDDEEITKLVFPNVKEGSILEFNYTVLSVGLYFINTQYNIPTKRIKVTIRNPTYYELKFKQNHLSNVFLNRNVNDYQFTFSGANIKALKDENYVKNINNYRGRIFIEKVYSRGKKGVKSWDDLAVYFNKRAWFGEELKNSGNVFKKDVKKLIGNETDQLEKAKKIYYFLQDRMLWDNYYSRGCDNIRKTYIDKTGNSGDINLLLVSMLRNFNIKADPVLIASKNKGIVLYPTITGFNNLAVAVEIEKDTYLLDASRKYSKFGLLNKNFIYGPGMIIYEDNTYKHIQTSITKKSSKIRIANVEIDIDNLFVKGNIKSRLDNQYAWSFRDDFNEIGGDNFEDDLETNNSLLRIDNLKVDNVENNDLPINLSYNFEHDDYIEIINDEIYFEPLLFFGLKENLFNEEEREFPIDFKFPYTLKFIINYKIPEGYKVKSFSKSKNIIIEDDIGSLNYRASVSEKHFQISIVVNINKSSVEPEYYLGLRSLFSEYFKTSNSKVVLSKI